MEVTVKSSLLKSGKFGKYTLKRISPNNRERKLRNYRQIDLVLRVFRVLTLLYEIKKKGEIEFDCYL
jgi:hypothetical protein